jgi:signal transduction histidine kinase
VDIWTMWWVMGTVLILALTYNVPTARGRGPRAVGLGALLVPVASLWLWALSVVAPPWPEFSGPHLFGAGDRTSAFWAGMLMVAAAAVFGLMTAWRAVCLAAAGLLAFGLYATYLAVAVQVWSNTVQWWNWFLFVASRPVVTAFALVTLAGGWTLARHAILGDIQARRSGLTARIDTLTQTRAEAIDSAAADLRRLERDLHDGAQARLVALGITLRAAEKLVKTSPDAAVSLIAECRENSSKALDELRNLVRGIYPPVLADRGLADAVNALALDCLIPVTTEIDLGGGRPPAPVESAVYFAVAETLNNVVKHANATHAGILMNYETRSDLPVRVERPGWSMAEVFGFGTAEAGVLRIEVTDDGVGGVDPDNGTGLRGIEQRLAAFDGILAVHSPAGGPTIVVIEVPCELPSPKISISS